MRRWSIRSGWNIAIGWSFGIALALGAGGAAADQTVGVAADGEEYVLRPRRLQTPPVIDGRLLPGEWDGAERVSDFTQFEPREGEPPTEETEAWFGYDAQNLYVGVRAYDSEPDKIMATIATPDGDMRYEDAIHILLDTFKDQQNAFLFITSPVGVKVDGLVRREGDEVIYDWDGAWHTAGSRDELGYVVEIAIPFKTLRFPPAEVQTWGFNIRRSIARKHEEIFWKPLSHSHGWYAATRVSALGELTGLEDIEQGRRYQMSPYLIAGVTDQTRDGGSEEVTDAGLDVKVHLTSKLVADLTYNTDFAEAEADDQEVNLTRFPLLFAEKRAFFLEGADLFQVSDREEPHRINDLNNRLFFSRSIGLSDDGGQEIPVVGGAKIAGEVGGLDVGALFFATDRTTIVAPGGGEEEVPETDFGVVRLRRKLFEKSFVGLIAMGKDPAGPESNRVAGADWDFSLGPSLRTGGYLVKSSTPGVDGDDWSGYSDLWYHDKHNRMHLAYTQLEENFRNELGFHPRLDMKKGTAYYDRIFWPENSRIKTWWLTYFVDYITDNDDNLESRINSVQLNGFLQNSSGASLKFYDNLEVLRAPFEIHPGVVIPPGEYDFGNVFFGFQTDYSKPIGGAGRLLAGEFYDGDVFQVFAYLQYRPMDGLLVAAHVDRIKVDLPVGEFTTELATFDASYSLTRPNVSAQVSLQRRDEENSLFRVLVKWGFRRGSKLYFLYEDLRDLTSLTRPFDTRVGLPGRQLVVKSVFTF